MTFTAVFKGPMVTKTLAQLQPGEIGCIVQNPIGYNIGRLVTCSYSRPGYSSFRTVQFIDALDAYTQSSGLAHIHVRILQPGDSIKVTA